jgi:threonine dehydrogenase-like Zn-dependent dehydrogenase
MKALAVLPGPREVRLVDHPMPGITQPDDVLLRILEVGICGTDKEICSFEYGTPPDGEDYLIIGHEALAEVVEVGPVVERLSKGDLVVPTVRRPCPHPDCLACRMGHQDFCYTGDFTERGIKEAHGYLTEYVVESQDNLVPVPSDLGDLAVLTEPLTIAEKALAQVLWLMRHRPPWLEPDDATSGHVKGLSGLVLGAGPVGVLGAMTLRMAGFRTYVYSRELPPSPRTDLVTAIGAEYVSSQALSFTELAARMGNIDLIYEAVGHSHFALEALHALGTNGIYVLTGVPGLQDLVQSDPASLMRNMVLRNQVLLGTVNAGPESFAAATADLQRFRQRWPEMFGSLVGGRYPLDQAPQLIFERPVGLKTVISFRNK